MLTHHEVTGCSNLAQKTHKRTLLLLLVCQSPKWLCNAPRLSVGSDHAVDRLLKTDLVSQRSCMAGRYVGRCLHAKERLQPWGKNARACFCRQVVLEPHAHQPKRRSCSVYKLSRSAGEDVTCPSRILNRVILWVAGISSRGGVNPMGNDVHQNGGCQRSSGQRARAGRRHRLTVAASERPAQARE